MHRGTTRAAAALLTIALATGCSDARLKNLTVGISADSVSAVMGHATPHRMATYAVGGAVWEVRLYARGTPNANDSIRWKKLSPVVIANGKYVGSGWSWWKGQSEKLGIPVPK